MTMIASMVAGVTSRKVQNWGSVMELPDTKSIVAVLMGLGMVGQYFGFTMPNAKQSTSNQVALEYFSDQARSCRLERIEHNEAHHPPEHPH